MAAAPHPRRDPRRAASVTPPALRDLLADSLALWGVPGQARIGADSVVVEAGATRLVVAPAEPGDDPVRWWVTRDGRRRPCPSVLGLLRTVRNALGVPGAAPVRVRVSSAP